MTIETLAAIGGIFSLLVFWHFVSDWVFQSHDEAMKKPTHHLIRARHCALYAILFLPVLITLNLTLLQVAAAAFLLFVSHFIEDTYYPILLWAKHIRRPPEFRGVGSLVFDPATGETRRYTEREAFITFVSTPLGKILLITMDQLVHIAFLLPIAVMAVM